jgi:hypothetical protein
MGEGSVANFDFGGKIRKSGSSNSMTYRPPNSRKSKFATEPDYFPLSSPGGGSAHGAASDEVHNRQQDDGAEQRDEQRGQAAG